MLLALALGVGMACGSDAHVGCSPGPTCSLRPMRFAPPPSVDAGAQTCDLTLRRCAAAQISAGSHHTCALTTGENVLCWGDNSQAQRGDTLDDSADAHATSTSKGLDRDAGVYLSKVSRVVDDARQVAAGGEHTCTLTSRGRVLCWGRAAEGQVDGHGDQSTAEAPVDPGLTDVTQLCAGALHSCAVVPAGVVCWGSDRYGQAGVEPTEQPLAPTVLADTQGAIAVACGVRHTCAVSRDRRVLCWGELIDETGASYIAATPITVSGLDDAIEISAGGGQSCALTAKQAVVCWGHNDNGQLGDGSTHPSATPVAVVGLGIGARHVAAGGGEIDGHLVGHSCAVDGHFQVACWGRDAEGQLGAGVGDDSSTPVFVLPARVDSMDQPTLGDIERVAVGALHSCALDSDGAVFCWGDDASEQLGSELGIGRERDPGVKGLAVRVNRFGRMQ